MPLRFRCFSRGLACSIQLLFAAALFGCATTGSYAPQWLATPDDLSGVQAKTVEDVDVSVAILTDEQAAVHFGADLGKNDLQALWLSVRNGSPHPLRFIRNTLDRDFYSADEAAIILKDEVSSRESDVLR